MTKPAVYNYQKAEDRIAELEAENIRLKEQIDILRRALNEDLAAEKQDIERMLDKWSYKLP